jgi:hypothetical protein
MMGLMLERTTDTNDLVRAAEKFNYEPEENRSSVPLRKELSFYL